MGIPDWRDSGRSKWVRAEFVPDSTDLLVKWTVDFGRDGTGWDGGIRIRIRIRIRWGMGRLG